MESASKVEIDGEIIYVKGLDSSGGKYTDDGALADIISTSTTVQAALKPILNLGRKLKSELRNLEPDETELTIQLSMGVDEDKLFFALADVSAEAQISIKWTWKKDEAKEGSE